MEQKETKPQTIEQYLNLKNTENFFDFSNGVDISDDEIRGRIIELVREVRIYCKQPAAYSIASGNCVIRVFYDPAEERADITICKNIKEGHIYFKDDGIIDTGGIPLHKDPNSKKWILESKSIWDN